MHYRRRALLVTLAILALTRTVDARAQSDLLQLEIGPETRKHFERTLELDAVLDTSTGEAIAPQTLANRLRDKRVVLIGEEHTDEQFHTVQLRVLEAMYDAAIPLLIGLEMFPASRQAVLDEWVQGALDESSFIENSAWYRVWGYNWAYYRAIFEFARAHQVRLVGLNEDPSSSRSEPHTGKAIVSDAASNDHRELVRAFFDVDSPVHGGLTPEQFERLFQVQAGRDATMAGNAAEALDRNPLRTMVVLAGTGHVLYDLGIARQLPPRYRESAASIMPVAVDAESRTVRASIAAYIWGIPPTDYPAYPELGVVTTPADRGLEVIHVIDDTPAAAAGIRAGDVLRSVGESPLADRSDLSRAIGGLSWGDVMRLEIDREGAEMELDVPLRR